MSHKNIEVKELLDENKQLRKREKVLNNEIKAIERSLEKKLSCEKENPSP